MNEQHLMLKLVVLLFQLVKPLLFICFLIYKLLFIYMIPYQSV